MIIYIWHIFLGAQYRPMIQVQSSLAFHVSVFLLHVTRIKMYSSVALNIERLLIKFQYSARILYELSIAYVHKCWK